MPEIKLLKRDFERRKLYSCEESLDQGLAYDLNIYNKYTLPSL